MHHRSRPTAPPASACSVPNSCFWARNAAQRANSFCLQKCWSRSAPCRSPSVPWTIGADKLPKWAAHSTFANPALGLTGIRLCLAEPNLFRTQLRALLRASQYGNLQILIPMLSSLHELQQAKMHIELAKQSLDRRRDPVQSAHQDRRDDRNPAAAVMIASFLKHVEFVSIGTNDLIQFTLAVDRADDMVAHLYEPTHPAVLHLISQTIKAADRAGFRYRFAGKWPATFD